MSGVLASGPNSEVLRGLWGRKPVALKVPRLPTSASLDAFHHELGVLLKLRQRPNVVQLLGAAAHPPDYSYLLALEEGSLSGLVGAKPLRGLSLVGCALQAARGLREVHLLGLLHRDVKPGNILLGHDLGPFHLAADIKRVGFWSAQHEARADLTMALGLLFLLIVGAGRWSMDAWLTAPHPSPSNRGRS